MATKPYPFRMREEDRKYAEIVADHIGGDLSGAIRYALRETARQIERSNTMESKTVWCESCLEDGEHTPATTHSVNPDWSGYDLCEECAAEYNQRSPINSTLPDGKQTDQEKATERVHSTPELAAHANTILYDWSNAAEHWPWVATAPVEEIVSWAEIIKRDED